MKKKEVTEIMEINRLTAYITFLPKLLRTHDIFEKRLEAYKSSQTTSHWANLCEIKKYPWGFKKTYENRGYSNINSLLIDGKCPEERLVYL